MMLEKIRIFLMKMFYHKDQEVSKLRGNCGPNISLKVEEFGKDMRLWTTVPNGVDVFKTYSYNRYKVDLAAHIFTSNLWMLSDIPCVHGQVAINFIHKDPIQFFSSWFHKDKYVATHMENILPVRGSNMLPRIEFTNPLPHLVRRVPGRPKIKRVKHASKSQDAKYLSQRCYDGTPPASEYSVHDGAPPVSKSGSLANTPKKRTKMIARRGGKAKITGPRHKTPKKTHDKQPMRQ
uniref:Zinc finger PMZ-type domain-containing protein n=1 Tax=Lactuca sativa TaxID=4236 RepID=A0A9R1V6H2_LACSA|nr:hypothetical protein LSAT_V11C600322240 [Lactuca sativa]